MLLTPNSSASGPRRLESHCDRVRSHRWNPSHRDSAHPSHALFSCQEATKIDTSWRRVYEKEAQQLRKGLCVCVFVCVCVCVCACVRTHFQWSYCVDSNDERIMFLGYSTVNSVAALVAWANYLCECKINNGFIWQMLGCTPLICLLTRLLISTSFFTIWHWNGCISRSVVVTHRHACVRARALVHI